MEKPITFIAALKGKKTYSTAIAGAAGAVAAVASGQATPLQGALAVLALGASAFARAGSKDDAAKVIASVNTAAIAAAAAAPLVGALVPGAAKAAGVVGELGAELAAATASTAS